MTGEFKSRPPEKGILWRILTLAFLLLTSAALLFGQAETGQVSGVVTDPSGAVVPNATVTLQNVGTGATRTATTGNNGQYIFTNLQPGAYQVSVTASGFTTYKQRVDVAVGGRATADARLGLGSQGTTVEVVGAGATAVNTSDQTLSSVVNTEQLASLPSLTRNPYDLVATAGNVQQDTQAGTGDARGAGYSINGQRSASTNILLDGGENVDYYTATVGQQTPMDSVQQFRVVTSGMTAEYGRAGGGVINVSTKQGTNALHGSAYLYNRISALASNTYDNASKDISKSRFTRNQFGFSLGGPIVKDKLFFFENAEWVRVRSPSQVSVYVPDPAFIAASAAPTQSFFSAYGKLRSDARVVGTLPVSALGSGVTPPAGFAGPALDLVNFTVPNDAGAGAPQNTWMNAARVDWNLTNNTSMFFRWAFYKENDFDGFINYSPYIGYDTGQELNNNNGLISITHVFSPRLVSQSKIVFQRLITLQPLSTAPVSPTLYLKNTGTATVNGTKLAFPGYSEFTPGNAIPFGGPQNLAQFYEDLSWTRGNHTFRFGGQYIYTQDNRTFGAYQEAVEALARSQGSTFGWNNFIAGNIDLFQAAIYPQGKTPCALDPTTGAVAATSNCSVNLPVGPPSFSRTNLYNDGAAYAQDTWKVSPRLTLDLGLRWEYFGVQHSRDPNLDANFYYGSGSNYFQQIASGFATTAPASPIGELWLPSKHNFAPRIGFALDLFGDGKTALRGGYGISYERNFNNVTYNVIQNPPNTAVLALQGSQAGTITVDNAGPLAGTTPPTKGIPPSSLRAVDENIKTAYAHQWNLSFERELAPNTVFTLDYSGSRGIHQYDIANINDVGFGVVYLGNTPSAVIANGGPLPAGSGTLAYNATTYDNLNPYYSAINHRGSNGDSYYHGLTAGLRSSDFRHTGLQLTFYYTWSHTIDDLSSTFSDENQNNGLGYLDPFNPSLDRASADYDARHRISVSGVWQVPGFKSQTGFLGHVLGGWEFGPTFTWHSGNPYTLFDCANSQSFYNCSRYIPSSGIDTSTLLNQGDQGQNNFNYQSFPAPVGYVDPVYGSSTLPTCTGLYHQGCSFNPNMTRRNAFREPGVWYWNLGVYKNIKLTERVTMQLRGEFYDVLNYKNFYVLAGASNADVSSTYVCPGGGSVGACGTPIVPSGAGFTTTAKKGGFGNPFDDHRNTQLAIRFNF